MNCIHFFRYIGSALLLALFAAPFAGHGQVQDSVFIALMKENKVPCAGIGIISNKKPTSIRVYGEVSKGKPAPANTVFNVASMTKPVVAMLTLKLVDQGKWNLDEPLAKYFTDPDVASDPRSKKLTTRHVLTHQTGFVNWRWLHPSKKLTFDFEPGTRFQYSGEGFEYLKNSLQKKFKKSLSQLVDEEIFKPLGMNDSRLVWNDSIEYRYASNYKRDGIETYNTMKRDDASAADDLLTTVKDYATFGSAVMDRFGINQKLYDDMVKPHVEMRKNIYRGLGWQVIPGLANGQYALAHDGGDEGVKTIGIFDPVSGEGMIFFTSSDNGFSIAPYVLEHTMSNGKEILQKILGQ